MALRTQKIVSIAEDLTREGVMTEEQLTSVRNYNEKPGKDCSDLMIESGFISERDLYDRLAKKAGIRSVSLTAIEHDVNVLKMLLPMQAIKWKVFPVSHSKGKLTVATSDPFDLAILDEARAELGCEIECVVASHKELEAVIRKYYGEKHRPINPAANLDAGDATKASEKGDGKGSEAAVSLVVAAVDEVLHSAIRERASDIHLEPTREGLKVRFRIDGVLEVFKMYPKNMQDAVLSRIKIMGSMDVAEHRIPQDGRTSISIEGKNMDIRIATYPTMFGEAAAIRVLAKENLISLDALGFVGIDKTTFEELVHRPHGIFLVTGPTGSGKTTTLYAGLHSVDRERLHVLSGEDPVENEIEGVDQTQINVRAGDTFPVILKSMLREDPDIIMVGEIRDQETAEIAMRAAMTGHLVLSTLHTNSAIGAISRLNDLGIATYLISSTLLGVVAQRLVRRLCQACKIPAPIPPESLRLLGPRAEGLTGFVGKGCDACGNRGFKGRIGIYEMIKMDEEMRVLVNNSAPDIRLREKAGAAGYKTLLEDGLEKIKNGTTTVDEVLKVCGGGH